MKVLTREEIDRIAGSITHVSDIPEYHRRGRVSLPAPRKCRFRMGFTYKE